MPDTRFLSLPLPDGSQTRMVYYAWGSGDKTALCVHGLTRNGRDFDFLADALAARGYRVFAPDLPGRGESAALQDASHYSYALYIQAVQAMFAQEEIQNCAYIGTSLGGIVGMMLAAQAPECISKLVLNDIGSVIAKEGLQRIGAYAANPPSFPSWAEARDYVAQTFLVPFGIREAAHIAHFLNISLHETPDGIRFRYDPAILHPLAAALQAEDGIQDIDLSVFRNAVTCPVLLLRGMYSDILRHETALDMAHQPGTNFIEWPGCGHAPALYAQAQVLAVTEWIDRTEY